MSPLLRLFTIAVCGTALGAGAGADPGPPIGPERTLFDAGGCRHEGPAPRGWAFTDSVDTAHYRIRYFGDPSDSNYAAPAHVSLVAAELERVWKIYREDWGLPAPRGWLELGAAGTPLIRVQLFEIDWAGGYATVGDWFDSDCPRSHGAGLTLENSMDETLLRTVIAHEVFHAFQYALRPDWDWFKESTCRWAEWQVVPEFRTATDIHRIVRFPYTTLWQPYPFSRTYGGVILWQFLQDRFGAPIALQVLLGTCHEEWIDALDRILREDHQTSLDDALVEFWQWNYHAGSANDGLHYSPEFAFPRIAFQATHEMAGPVDAALPDSLVASYAATNAIRFEGRAHREHLRIRFDGEPELADHRTLSVITTTEPRTHRIVATATPDSDGDCEMIVEDWDLVDSVCLLVTNHRGAQAHPGRFDFRYAAEETGAEVFDVDWNLSHTELAGLELAGAPNPFRGATQIRYESLGGPTRLGVFDVQGRELRRLASGPRTAGHFHATWDGLDDRGRRVGSGVYFVHLRTGGRRNTHRIAVVR